jgi:hypothetical protein
MADDDAQRDDDARHDPARHDSARDKVRDLVLHQYLARDGWDHDQIWALLLEIGRAVFGEDEVAVWRAAEEERSLRERRRAAEVRLRPRLP